MPQPCVDNNLMMGACHISIGGNTLQGCFDFLCIGRCMSMTRFWSTPRWRVFSESTLVLIDGHISSYGLVREKSAGCLDQCHMRALRSIPTVFFFGHIEHNQHVMSTMLLACMGGPGRGCISLVLVCVQDLSPARCKIRTCFAYVKGVCGLLCSQGTIHPIDRVF